MSGNKEEQSLAIRVEDVTKVYRLYEKPIDRLKETVSITHKNYHRDFYALNGLSFQVKKGETVGIIGTNGSGKSTILKIITGVLTPTTGKVEVDGKISALLELGAGFNMDYTGIENIYMNGTMMGYTRKEMDAKLQEILDFAEIGDFVYQPVKTYSSGMFVRLAFALAINVEPEILIVDEALSVGDVFFQSKCYRRMEEIRKNGTTIIMVTHDLGVIAELCDEIIVLYGGRVCERGTAEDIFYRPRHEYTKGLLRSIPNVDRIGEKLIPIPGTPINLLNMPKGCAFCPRCENAMKICIEQVPPEMQMPDGHYAACWLNVKEEMLAKQGGANK